MQLAVVSFCEERWDTVLGGEIGEVWIDPRLGGEPEKAERGRVSPHEHNLVIRRSAHGAGQPSPTDRGARNREQAGREDPPKRLQDEFKKQSHDFVEEGTDGGDPPQFSFRAGGR